MFGVFHRAKLIFGRKSKGYVSCVLTDRYDFKCEYPTSLAMVANDYAWFSQVVGASHPYNIYVNMWMTKKKITLLKKGEKMIKKIVVLIVTISIVLAGCNKNDILTSIGKEIGVDISSEKILEEKDDHGGFLVME